MIAKFWSNEIKKKDVHYVFQSSLKGKGFPTLFTESLRIEGIHSKLETVSETQTDETPDDK